MGIFDKLRRRAGDAVGQHGDKAERGIDKAAEFVDEKTGGKHAGKIDEAADKAKGAVEDVAENESTRRKKARPERS